jgi:hypothetical protein
MSWQMFAMPLGDGDWTGVGDHWYASQHGEGAPTPVQVTQDAEGSYLGWLDAEDGMVIVGETPPSMIERKEIFSIQFPYGYHEEQKAGRGRAIPLTIKEITE